MKTRPPSKPAPAVQAIDRLLHDTEIRLDTRLRDLERENAIAGDAAETRFRELALLTGQLNETRAQAERREAELHSRHGVQLAEIRAAHTAELAETRTAHADQLADARAEAEQREADLAAAHAAALAQADTQRADQAAQYQARLAELHDRAAQAEARLAALQSSRSWRLSAPLRALSALIRR